jgi:hypothetical protein
MVILLFYWFIYLIFKLLSNLKIMKNRRQFMNWKQNFKPYIFLSVFGGRCFLSTHRTFFFLSLHHQPHSLSTFGKSIYVFFFLACITNLTALVHSERVYMSYLSLNMYELYILVIHVFVLINPAQWVMNNSWAWPSDHQK